MTTAKFAILPDRGAVSVMGEDAEKFLQGLITNDMGRLTAPAEPTRAERTLGTGLFAGLLSPQGKILFEFFVVRAPGGLLLDTSASHAADLAKRLTMYKLRSKVEVKDVSAGHVTIATLTGDGSGYQTLPAPRDWSCYLTFLDMRGYPSSVPSLGRWIGSSEKAGDLIEYWRDQHVTAQIPVEAYDEFRVQWGIPEGGKDYAFGDAFPHEANFDLLHGVDFEKGCYVGQEVVSRMQNKTIVRKRVVRIEARTGAIASGADVKMGEVVIGKVGTVAGNSALALLRLDRAIEAMEKGVGLTAGETPITVDSAMLDLYRKSLAERAAAAAS